MSVSLSETQKIAVAILDLLAAKKVPCAPEEIIQSLAKKNYDPWQVREVIWNLTAKSATELTWDRKLKLGPHSDHHFALAA